MMSALQFAILKYRKSKQSKLFELEGDISYFYLLLENLKKRPDLIDDPIFLSKTSSSILRIHRHAKELSEIKNFGRESTLIEHMLDTPWGAPFISNETLLDAATTYPDEIPKRSKLHEFLLQIASHRTNNEIFTIQELLFLKEEISKRKI
jgi:hypothetical protein